MKMATQDLTSPVAANHLAAGAFFSAKMTAWDLLSPVVAIQLVTGRRPCWGEGGFRTCLRGGGEVDTM